LIFSLEFMPRQAVINWANSVAGLPQFADHTAVLLTHTYLNWNDQRTNNDPNEYGFNGDGNAGVPLWNELVKLNENFEMTFSGHVGGDGVSYVRSLGDDGNAVHQMLLNTQFETNGGNGWFRVLEFLEDGKSVRVRTYSPFLGLSRTDPANSYMFQLSPLPPRTADFDGDGDVDGRDFLAWQRGNSPAPHSAEDLQLWQSNFTAVLSAVSVPEPLTGVPLGCLVAGLYMSRRR
jgi:hypothetical protein